MRSNCDSQRLGRISMLSMSCIFINILYLFNVLYLYQYQLFLFFTLYLTQPHCLYWMNESKNKPLQSFSFSICYPLTKQSGHSTRGFWSHQKAHISKVAILGYFFLIYTFVCISNSTDSTTVGVWGNTEIHGICQTGSFRE